MNEKKLLLGEQKEKRATIERYLVEIDWKLRHHGCDHWYFYNHKNKCTGMYVISPETDGRICYEIPDRKGNHYKMPSITFYLKGTMIDLLDNDCVSFSGKNDESIFILCQNFDKRRDELKKLKKVKK